ncbi:MAG: AAA family ATPase [Chloroflexi bacterium]|nr:AAA family ATPase [Chloroflexota bacterium]
MPACANCGYNSEAGFRFCPSCGAGLAAATPAHEQRKTVTVLFCDLTGSTALGETLDPERLRALLARYFERMKAIVERHGGSVEKFIGDAVMAVFGVPVLHEDDALRAVRAAIEMRDAIPELGLQGRIGVMTGEVVTGTAERLATGDAVNVAARLEAAADPGEVLIGQPTLALVRDAVEVGPVQPLDLKGKSEPVPAYRLVSARDAPERRHEAKFVGRRRESAIVRETWERVLAEQRCELVTIIGDAGVGKSRLVDEVLTSVDATVVRGRCLPYGEGITYWPVVEVLKQLDVLPPDPAAGLAIQSLLGESKAPTSADEIAWAFRKTLEHAAAQRSLVVVFDDIQWGEETFRDLIEHVALLSSGASILLLCLARPELTEQHAAWPVTLRLEPLGADDVDELMSERIPATLRDRIARAAGGNPLFVEEMLAMAQEANGEVIVPPTLQALLAARLDQLDPAERGVLERGAVEGEIFHRGAVQALSPDEMQVTPRLAALVRKELVRPDSGQLVGEDGFRFRHLLIRDAAYDALPKAVRADLHQRFAIWLEGRGAELVQLDEIVGYHLEQAYRYRAELGMADDPILTAGGHRAQLRADYRAAVSLYERAAALVPATEIDLALEAELGEALYWAGDGVESQRRAVSLAERALALGDRVGELCGRVRESLLRTFLEPEGATEELAILIEEALPVFRAAGDDAALYIGYSALGQVGNMRGQMDAGLEAFEQAATHAQQAGMPHEELGWRSTLRFMGTTPVAEVLAWLDANEPREGRNYWLRSNRAKALAMLGRFDEARAILADSRTALAERGGGIPLGTTAIDSVEVELWAGDPAAAAEFGAEGCRLLEEMGERSILSTAAGMLAQALYALDRLEEADGWAGRAAELGASDDAITQMLWRQVRAKVLARRGELAEGERLAREAVAVCEKTDFLDAQGDVYADLAEVLSIGGRPQEAAAALGQAIACYQGKGNLASSQHAQARITAPEDAEPG